MLAGPTDDARNSKRRAVATLATAIVIVSFVVYVASQFQGAGILFNELLPDSFGSGPGAMVWPILIGGGIVAFYTLLGGFWAVSLTDTLQGLMMAGTAVLLPVAALMEVGGLGALQEGVRNVPEAGFDSVFGDAGGTVAGAAFVLGLLTIGLGYPGQPHVVNRFMALGSDRDVLRARRYAMLWAIVVYAGMVLLGLAGRVMFEAGTVAVDEGERMLFALNMTLLPPVVAGVVLAAVLSAIMSTADSQLLVAASALSHDVRSDEAERDGARSLRTSRLTVLAISAVAIGAAVVAPPGIFDNVLSAWSAMGAAFGPLLLVTLRHGAVSFPATMGAMGLGFATSVGLDVGDAARWTQLLPWLLALWIARAGVRPRPEAGERTP